MSRAVKRISEFQVPYGSQFLDAIEKCLHGDPTLSDGERAVLRDQQEKIATFIHAAGTVTASEKAEGRKYIGDCVEAWVALQMERPAANSNTVAKRVAHRVAAFV